MIKLKNNKQQNQLIFFNSLLGNYTLYYIDYKICFINEIKIKKNLNNIFFFNKNKKKLNFFICHKLNIFIKKNVLLLNFDNFEKKKKKQFIKLYITLIQKKLKGLIQKFKINIYLNGIGFKFFLKNNFLILKIGLSHNIIIIIPKIITIKQINYTHLILESIDFEFLTRFIFFIKKYKKTNVYKKKGIFLKNEKIFLKDYKKNKK